MQQQQHVNEVIRGIRYHCIVAGPEDGVPVLLIHGFPGLSYCWRKQIGPLASLGYRVIVPDCRGYGESPCSDDDLSIFSWKSLCMDLLALLLKVTGKQEAIWIGHDWGGMIAWRACLHFPKAVIAVASVCTAYAPPSSRYLSIDDVVKFLPQFEYQRWFNDPKTAKLLDENAEEFLKITFRGRADESDGAQITSLGGGKGFPPLEPTKRSNLLTDEEFGHYLNQYRTSGFSGPLAYYKTRRINYEEELGLAKVVDVASALMIVATHDKALPPSMAANMPKLVKNLTMREIEAAHWVQSEQPERLNELLTEWLVSLQPILKTRVASAAKI